MAYVPQANPLSEILQKTLEQDQTLPEPILVEAAPAAGAEPTRPAEAPRR